MNPAKFHFDRCLASAFVLALFCPPILAAENEGSLDNVWKDQPSQGGSAGGHSDPTAANRDLQPYQGKAVETDANAANPTPLDRGQNTALSAPSESAPAATHDPPAAESKTAEKPGAICQLESFLHSPIVMGTSWPNIGPFKTTTPGPYSLVDACRNRIGLAVQDNKVIAAELDLVGGANQIENFANLEMSADFLMEALGSKPKKINEVNGQLEANTAVVNGSFIGPIGLVCDPYVIILNKGEGPISCKIRASNKAVNGAETAQIAMAEMGDSVPTTIEATTPPRRNPIASSTRRPPAGTPPVIELTPAGTTPPEDKYATLLDKVTKEPPSTAPRGLAGARTEGRKQEFLDLIQSWQRLKKTAVRQRETADLPQILAGAALARQSNAIKWLANNHKYYDMTPKGAQVDRIEEQTPDQKYLVYAQVRESTKYVEENSGQVLKDSDESYNVRYTVERSGDHWVISDSALIKPSGTTPPSGSKPQH